MLSKPLPELRKEHNSFSDGELATLLEETIQARELAMSKLEKSEDGEEIDSILDELDILDQRVFVLRGEFLQRQADGRWKDKDFKF